MRPDCQWPPHGTYEGVMWGEFSTCTGCETPEACDAQRACHEDAGWLDEREESD